MTTKLSYRGFEIDHANRIYKNGKQVFTAKWQDCGTPEEAQQLIDNSIQRKELTNFDQFQQNKYGNVLPMPEATPDGELYESGIDELNRIADWMNAQAEQQMFEQQR